MLRYYRGVLSELLAHAEEYSHDAHPERLPGAAPRRKKGEKMQSTKE